MREWLLTVRETNGLENACLFLWVTMGSYWQFVDGNLELLFEDPRFPTRSKEVVDNKSIGFSTQFYLYISSPPSTTEVFPKALMMLRQIELELDRLLILMHNSLPDNLAPKDQSTARVQLVLTRMAKYCEQLDSLVCYF